MTLEKPLDNQEDHRERGVWVRRQNRGLSGERQDALDTLLPQLSIDIGDLREDGALVPSSLFDNDFPVWMEIGFGGGEHVIGLLEQEPDINIIAVEPFINGMALFLKDLPEVHYPRVRVLMDDAVTLARSLAPDSVERLYILNPDPWHKARHHKRRIVRAETLDVFSRILKPGGDLIMSSDVPDMVDWMVTHSFNHPDFEWQAGRAEDWSVPPEDWITTRYEVKGAKGADKMSYLFFKKR